MRRMGKMETIEYAEGVAEVEDDEETEEEVQGLWIWVTIQREGSFVVQRGNED
jgi:hypothetical protein